MNEPLRTRVEHLIRTEIAPALELDGTAIEVLDVSNGVVRVRLGSVCSGCPATIQFVIHGLEEELRQRISEVEYLEAVP
jgi:Fe-S cluster biogenesis protein NfuA